jgi:hypothetical protein
MRYEEYKAKDRKFYLSRPAEKITADKFLEMPDVLPPKKCENTGDFESFLMSEHWSGPYTSHLCEARSQR